MVERSTITIEPYRQAGIMGAEVELNEPVIGRFIEKTDFVRDIVVQKGMRREKRGIENLGTTLAFKKMTLPSLDIRQTPTFTLSKANSGFIVGIDDEKLAEDADLRMQKKYKKDPNISGQETFKQLFVASLNRTVKDSLKVALVCEKLDVGERLPTFLPPIISIGSGAFSLANGSEYWFAINIGVYLMTNAALNAYSYPLRKSGHKIYRFRYENNVFLPTLPVDSYIRGRLFLATNGRKLVTRVDSTL